MVQIFNTKRGQKGFTLIELLVVIAIIGILAGIVLVALGGARNRAKDARIMSDMSQIRIQNEIIFLRDGDYDRIFCVESLEMQALCNDIGRQGGRHTETGAPEPYITRNNPFSPSDKYCVEVQLNSGKYWCVDYKLRSAQYDTNPACSGFVAYWECE